MADFFGVTTLGKEGGHDACLGKKVRFRTADAAEAEKLRVGYAAFGGGRMI